MTLATLQDLAADRPEEPLRARAHRQRHVAEVEQRHRLVARLHRVVVDLHQVAVGDALECVDEVEHRLRLLFLGLALRAALIFSIPGPTSKRLAPSTSKISTLEYATIARPDSDDPFGCGTRRRRRRS
jgi:hypothetical protein